jgi:hypothetical protein
MNDVLQIKKLRHSLPEERVYRIDERAIAFRERRQRILGRLHAFDGIADRGLERRGRRRGLRFRPLRAGPEKQAGEYDQ